MIVSTVVTFFTGVDNPVATVLYASTRLTRALKE